MLFGSSERRAKRGEREETEERERILPGLKPTGKKLVGFVVFTQQWGFRRPLLANSECSQSFEQRADLYVHLSYFSLLA